MKAIRLLLLVPAAGLVLAVGCNPSPGGREPGGGIAGVLAPGTRGAPPDTGPPTLPHLDPPVIQPAIFVGSDSTSPGGTGAIRWMVGNDSDDPYIVPWTLTCERRWPGLPVSGRFFVDAQWATTLSNSIAVPDTAAPGMVSFWLSVTRPLGARQYRTEGTIRVISR